MKLVIDTNQIIAALIKDGICRKIILDSKYNFISPDFTTTEINKYKELILKKSGLSERSFDLILNILLEKIDIRPIIEYKNKIPEALGMISDKKDVPFLALAMSENADGIWSDDKHFKEQEKIKIISTKEFILSLFSG